MRVAALYDIHGNLPALEAVLRDVEAAGVDQLVGGGDVVPGPMSAEVIDALRDPAFPTRFVRGNGERDVLALREGSEPGPLPETVLESMRWVASRIGPERAAWLAGWPRTVTLRIPPLGDVLFCHATPRSDGEIFTRLTPSDRVAPAFRDVEAGLVVCGHTHMQFERTVGHVRVVNAGSVGMVFGPPGAYRLLLDCGVELRRTSYDLRAAADRIRATDYPGAEAFAAGNVLAPPTEAGMLEALERGALR